jgi:hypothetical protein
MRSAGRLISSMSTYTNGRYSVLPLQSSLVCWAHKLEFTTRIGHNELFVDPQLVTQYVDDIYAYLRYLEVSN